MTKIILGLLLLLCMQEGSTKEIRKISVLCDTGNIDKMEIIYYPSSILTNRAMSSNELNKRYTYKIEINDIQEGPYRNEIIKLLNIDYSVHKSITDIRWGVLIKSRNNKICRLYFNSFGSYGEVNNIKVHFYKNTIIKWIKNRIPLFTKHDYTQ